jgi:predicted ferric reductase
MSNTPQERGPTPREARKWAFAPGLVASLLLALAVIPLAIAALTGEEPENRWREFSAALAMSGFALLLAQFLLSGRFFLISGKAGIDVILHLHQLAARTLFVFLLIHPLLYAAPRLATGRGGTGDLLLTLFMSERLRTGVVAWILLILIMAMGIWRDRLPIRYEAWRLTHGLGAGVIAALGLHHTLSVGTYSASPVLAGIWLLLSAIAFGSLAVIYGLRPLMQIRDPYKVVAVEPAALRTWRVVIEPESGKSHNFAAGQFVWLNIGHSPFSLTEHPFSISSAPAALPRMEFTIKESGDFTDRLGSIQPGTAAYIDGPHGSFILPDRLTGPPVFIAGGVGIAPVLSLLRSLGGRGEKVPVTIIYGNRVAEQIVAREELVAMRESIGLRLHLVLGEPPPDWTGPAGDLTQPVLEQCLADRDAATRYYVFGPLPMMDAVERSLRAMGVKPGQIVSERFRYD